MTTNADEGLEALRDAVRRAIEATSLRAVARASRVRPSILTDFVAGTEPYAGTLRRLYIWRSGGKDFSLLPELATPGVRAAFASLLGHAHEESRLSTLTAMLLSLQQLYQAHGPLCPPWVPEVLQRWMPDPAPHG